MSTLGRAHPAATSADALAVPGGKGDISDIRSDSCPAGTCRIQSALSRIEINHSGSLNLGPTMLPERLLWLPIKTFSFLSFYEPSSYRQHDSTLHD
jgi:hypothetical protein